MKIHLILALALAGAARAQPTQMWSQGNPSNEEQFALEQINAARADPVGYVTNLLSLAPTDPVIAGFVAVYGPASNLESTVQTNLQTRLSGQSANPGNPSYAVGQWPLVLYPLFTQLAATEAASPVAQGLPAPTFPLLNPGLNNEQASLPSYFEPPPTGNATFANAAPITGPNATGGTADLAVSLQGGGPYGGTSQAGCNYANLYDSQYITPREWILGSTALIPLSGGDFQLGSFPVYSATDSFQGPGTMGHLGMCGIRISDGPGADQQIMAFAWANNEALTSSDLPFGASTVFVTGAVFQDKAGTGMYALGEGMAGVTVTLNQGPWYAVTADAGGYAIPVPANSGNYVVTVTGGPFGASGSTASVNVGATNVKVDFVLPGAPLVILVLQAPPSTPVAAGTPVSMAVSAGASSGVSYQWQLNGANIAGATAATYSLAAAGKADQGTYSVVATNAAGSATATVGSLTVVSDARLINLSARAYVESGANILIAGFVTGGTGTKSMLIRGVGPTLGQAPFDVPNSLPAATLTFFNSDGSVIASNSQWNSNLAPTFAALGAFALPVGSDDAALLETVAPGAYTAQVSSTEGPNGVGLVELYDADQGPSTSRLVNISGRAFVGSAGNILIGGFVITGTADETVLIRGIGPTLGSSPFNVPGALSNPVLTLFDSAGQVIATNVGWGTAPVLGTAAGQYGIESATAATFTELGAFGLPIGSPDSAMVVTLPPGAYTAQVSSVNETAGVGLVEIYEIP